MSISLDKTSEGPRRPCLNRSIAVKRVSSAAHGGPRRDGRKIAAQTQRWRVANVVLRKSPDGPGKDMSEVNGRI